MQMTMPKTESQARDSDVQVTKGGHCGGHHGRAGKRTIQTQTKIQTQTQTQTQTEETRWERQRQRQTERQKQRQREN